MEEGKFYCTEIAEFDDKLVQDMIREPLPPLPEGSVMIHLSLTPEEAIVLGPIIFSRQPREKSDANL